MNFRQVISKEIAHKMQEADINEADKKSMSPPRQYSIPFARVHFSYHKFYVIHSIFLNFHAFLQSGSNFFLKAVQSYGYSSI